MSCVIPPDQFPPWMGKVLADTSRIVLALGQIEEAMGLLEDDAQAPITSANVQSAWRALERARNLLRQEVGL